MSSNKIAQATFGEAKRIQKIQLTGQVVLPLTTEEVQTCCNGLIQCLVGTLKGVAPDQHALIEDAINGADDSEEEESYITDEDVDLDSEDDMADEDHSNVVVMEDEKAPEK